MDWSDYTYGGRTYHLGHLHGLTYHFELPASITQPAKQCRVRVNYGLHCFTRDPNPGENYTRRQVIFKNNEGRLFCPARWEQSLELPEIFRTIQTRACFPTDRNNYVTLSVLTPLGPRDYAVFFKVTAANSDDWDATLTVISAHPKPGYRPRESAKPFNVILGEKMRKAAQRRASAAIVATKELAAITAGEPSVEGES